MVTRCTTAPSPAHMLEAIHFRPLDMNLWAHELRDKDEVHMLTSEPFLARQLCRATLRNRHATTDYPRPAGLASGQHRQRLRRRRLCLDRIQEPLELSEQAEYPSVLCLVDSCLQKLASARGGSTMNCRVRLLALAGDW
jgi:hypothetical protein